MSDLPRVGGIDRTRPWSFEALGTDAAFGLDLGASSNGDWALASGEACLLQDLAHRFATPRGSYAIDPAFGSDVFDFLNAEMDELTRNALAVEVKETLEDDPRVDEATARVVVVGSVARVEVTVVIATRENPLNLVFGWDIDTRTLTEAALGD